MLAAELARRGRSASLIEGGGRAGRGTAFSTAEDRAFAQRAGGQDGRLGRPAGAFRGKAVEAEGYEPDDFVPRRRFGAYLRDILDEARGGGLVTVVGGSGGRQPSAAATAGRFRLADGSRIEARALALAQGNQPPEPPDFARGHLRPQLFVNDPWSDEGRAARVAASRRAAATC